MGSAFINRLYILLAVLLAIGIAVTYAFAHHPIPPRAGLLMNYGPLSTILYWLRQDARSRRFPLALDWGFIALIAWPIAIPWYLFATRGSHAWPLTITLLLAMLAPWFLAGVIILSHLIQSGSP